MRIDLYGTKGAVQSSGTVTVSGARVSIGYWLLGGSHALRTPLALIRRIALDWIDDGAYQSYEGKDDETGVTFRVTA